MTAAVGTTLDRSILDRMEILEVLAGWGVLRDSGQLDLLGECFAPDGVMHTSGSSGPASRFIENARKSQPGSGLAQHIYGGGVVEVAGDRALAQSRMLVMSRKKVGRIAVDLTGFVLMFDRFVRTPQGWRILERFPLYERDRLDLVDRADSLDIDLSPFAAYPQGLQHIAFVQRAGGREVPANVLSMSADGFAATHAEWRRWLQG